MDSQGSIYIADRFNNRVRKVAQGVITTVAGDGVARFAGDGGSATAASLNYPSSVALDSAGNLYIADTGNHLIRKVSNGIITTIAGNGLPGPSGDGGPATIAAINPFEIALDSSGNLYLTSLDTVRKISNGTITTIGQVSVLGYSADGGLSTNAKFCWASGIAAGSKGVVYFADSCNNNIRRLTPAANGTLTLSRNKLSFGVNGSTSTSGQSVDLIFSSTGMAWTALPSQPNITVSPSSGVGNAAIRVTVTAGVNGSIVVDAPVGNAPQSIQVNIAAPTPSVPYGSFDTPLNNTNGIAGAIPVTVGRWMTSKWIA